MEQDAAGDYTLRLARIRRYPVKGLGGEDLSEVTVTEAGLPLDRVVALANARAPVQPHGKWTPYGAFHALTASPALGVSAARVRVASGQTSSADNGRACSEYLLDPNGDGL